MVLTTTIYILCISTTASAWWFFGTNWSYKPFGPKYYPGCWDYKCTGTTCATTPVTPVTAANACQAAASGPVTGQPCTKGGRLCCGDGPGKCTSVAIACPTTTTPDATCAK